MKLLRLLDNVLKQQTLGIYELTTIDSEYVVYWYPLFNEGRASFSRN